MAIDIIYCVEIATNFLKRTRAHKDLKSIALNYVSPSFPDNLVLDLIGTLPGLISG